MKIYICGQQQKKIKVNAEATEVLFEPFKIGKKVVPNRIVMPPMVMGVCRSKGER